MSTVIRGQAYIRRESTKSLRSSVKNFLRWSAGQQENRLGWQGLALVLFGSFLTPVTILTVCLSRGPLFLIINAIVIMEANLVVNLVAAPTKISIPVFFGGIVVELAIIFTCVFTGI